MALVKGVVFRRLEAVREQITITASKILEECDSHKDINVNADGLVVTLPLITTENLGISYSIRNIGADGDNIVTIAPNALDGINGTIANASADVVASGAVDKDWVNTKATANEMDYVDITAVALTKWAIDGGVGLWASEA